MDKDRIAGSAEVVRGKIKEAVGKVVGDAKLEAEGEADKIEGKIQNAVGGIIDTIKEHSCKVVIRGTAPLPRVL